MTKVKSTLADSYVYQWVDGKPKFLLLKRQMEKFYGGLWQGVAGQIEEGETAVQTIIRELKEETGLQPTRIFVTEKVITFYQSHNDQITVVPVFGIEVSSNSIQLSQEHSEYCWVDIETAVNLLSWKQQKEVIYHIYQLITKENAKLSWLDLWNGNP